MTSRYYTMTDSTGASGFLPTVIFTSPNSSFTSAQRIAQLASIPGSPTGSITGFYEADFANNITVIDVSAFAFDTKVVVVTINGVTTINNDAFYGCTALRSITLDTSVNTTSKKYLLTSIGNRALYGCTSLRNLHIPDTVKLIPDYLCYGCTSLEVAVMGYGCSSRDVNDNYIVDASINQFAFANCSKLQFFIIPETVGYVGDSAFQNDPSLSYVAVLGKPTFVGTSVFAGTTMNTNAARYVYDICQNLTSVVPSSANKNQYYEYVFQASSGTTITSANVNTRFTAIGATPSWVKVKLKGTGTGYVSAIGTTAFRSNPEIGATNYAKIIGFSFPPSLTTIGDRAFEANSTYYAGYGCYMAAHYIPNTVATTSPDGLGDTYNFNLSSDTTRNASHTKQFVFQSGTSNITLGHNTFLFTSAKAIIIPNTTSLPSKCFQSAWKIQLFSFFQKNAYTALTRLDHTTNDGGQNIFSYGFKSEVTGYTHYLYIPKQITRISTNSFLGMTDQLIITAYCSYADGNGAAGAGLCTTAVSNFLEPGRFTGTAPIFQLINNYYDANGLTLGTAAPTVGTCHVLYPSGVKTISNQFSAKVNLKSIAVHHSATQTVAINTEAFNNCTGLNFVYFNNRVKTLGYNVFRNTPLSNSFDLIDAHPLESIYHATFYTDNITCNLKQITIPNSVKYLGSFVVGCSATGQKTAFTTLSFETGITFWGDNDNTVGAATFTDTNTGSARYMAIPATFCINCDFLTNVSFLNTVDANNNAITADANGALTRPNNSLPITTRNNSQILSPLIKRIGNSVFQANHRLQSIRIPEGVTTIDSNAFYETHSLTYLYLPDSLTSAIGANAFYRINYTNKFSYTGKEVSIRIPQSRIDDTTTSIFNHGNVPTYNFTVVFDTSSGKVASGVLGRFTTAAVDTYIKYHVVIQPGITSILGGTTANTRAFDGYTGLKTVTIPDSVADIGVSAFSGCTGLTNAFISSTSNLTVIGSSAFLNCSALTSFFIPNSLDGINASTFSGCTGLASVSYGDNPGIKYIGVQAFYNATRALTSIFIPASVVTIGNSAFVCNAGTNILNTVTFGAGSRLKSIDYQCFGQVSNTTSAAYLRDLVLPNTVRAIGPNQALRNAFTQVHSANLVLPSSLEFLSESILYSDRGESTLDISNIYLPMSITNVPGPRNHSGYITSGVGLNVFRTNSSKSNSLIYLPSHLSGYTFGGTAFPDANRGRSFYKTVSFTANPLLTLGLSSGNPANTTNASTTTQIHADIKDGVTVIGGGTSIASANSGNVLNLISVNIPSTVTTISANAFNGCSAMAYVTFSENSHLTTIGNSAFLGCTTLPDILLPDTLTTIGPNAFNGCSNLASISIPYNVTSIGAKAFTRSNLKFGTKFGTKLGQDIDGEAASDESGDSVSMNSDGTIIAIGAYLNDGTTGTDTDIRGHVRVYKYQTITDTTWANYTVNSFVYVTNKPIVVNGGDALPVANKKYWVQMGSDIDGEAASDRSGWSVSLSADGMTVAIGAVSNFTTAGYVRVYKYDSGKTTNVTDQTSNDFGPIGWRRLGKDIAGEAAGDQSGSSVSLSSDGTTVAIGASYTTNNTGQVRVYKYQTITDWTNYTINSFTYNGTFPTNKPIVVNGGDANPVANKYYWVQQGVDIDGEAATNFSGYSVSLSADGTIVAIGAFNNTGVNGATSGQVRVYKYQTIPVAITTWTNNYTANSFIYNGTSPTDKPIVVNGGDTNPVSGKYYWVQQGVDIDGEATTDWSGRSVSLSDDGTIVAIGARTNDGTPVLADRGHVRVYKYDSGKTTNVTDQASNDFGPIGWRRLGQDIDGEASYDYSGWSVSLSADGTTVAIGAPSYTSSSTGQVRIYTYDSAKTTSVTDQTSIDFGPIGWRRIGQDIDGDSGDKSGTSVSLSKDGYTVAIGAPSNTSSKGRVRVYTIDQVTVPIRLHQRLYNDISGSLQTYFPGISTSSFQVIPELRLTNTLNPSKLTISQINNMYIRYRQSQLGGCTFVTVSATSGGILSATDITTALASSTGFVHLDISTNVTTIDANVCNANTRIYSVAISKTVTSVGDAAFSGCTNLSYLSFHPDSVCTNLTYQSFHNTGIFDLALPDSLTAIGASAFQTSRNLTYACIPKNVTAFGTGAFHNCSKLTSVAVPATLSDTRNSSYFNTDGTNTTAITFTTYSNISAIPHFKLSDYSMPNGIVQNVIDSAVKYIDHRAYAYYPDITLYAVTTNKQTQTAGQYNYIINDIKMPIMPAAFWLNGGTNNSFVSNSMFPIYRSVPDLNVFSGSSTTGDWTDNLDDFYILMPGYSISIYNNLYDEENLFTDAPTQRYYDNEFGKVPLNITINVANTTSSILIMFNGCILSKYFAS